MKDSLESRTDRLSPKLLYLRGGNTSKLSKVTFVSDEDEAQNEH